jgi:hypothetical protein
MSPGLLLATLLSLPIAAPPVLVLEPAGGELLQGLTLQSPHGVWVLAGLKLDFDGAPSVAQAIPELHWLEPGRAVRAVQRYVAPDGRAYRVYASAELKADHLSVTVRGARSLHWEATWKHVGGPITRVFWGKGIVLDHPTAPYESAYPTWGHDTYMRGTGLEADDGALYYLVDGVPIRFHTDPPAGTVTFKSSLGTTTHDLWFGPRPFPRMLLGLRSRVALPGPPREPARKLWGKQILETGASTEQLWKDIAAPMFERGLTDVVFIQFGWSRGDTPAYWPPKPGSEPERMRAFSSFCRENGALYAPYDSQLDFETHAQGYAPGRLLRDLKGAPVVGWEDRPTSKVWHVAGPLEARKETQRVQAILKREAGHACVFEDVVAGRFFDALLGADGRRYTGLDLFREYGRILDTARDTAGNDNGRVDAGDPPLISETAWEWQIPHCDTSQAYYFPHFFGGQTAKHGWFPHLSLLYHRDYADFGMGWYQMYAGKEQASVVGDERWRNEAWVLDDYVSAQILMGNAGYLWPDVYAPTSQRMAYMGRLYYRMHAFNRMVAGQAMTALDLDGDDVHRFRIRYANGATVLVNRGNSPWKAGGHTLGPWGYAYSGPGATGYHSVPRGRTEPVDFVQAPEEVYADGRGTPYDFGGIVTDGPVAVWRKSRDEVRVVPLGPVSRLEVDLSRLGFGSGMKPARGHAWRADEGRWMCVTPLDASMEPEVFRVAAGATSAVPYDAMAGTLVQVREERREDLGLTGIEPQASDHDALALARAEAKPPTLCRGRRE